MSVLQSIANLFGTEGEQNKNPFGWKDISKEQELSDIMKASRQKVQVIYKHSSRCATSYFALKNIESISPVGQEQADFFMVDVIGQRPLSMYIADALGIRHESPQLFVIKHEEVIWHGSHHQVQAETLDGLL